ncbi:MAG: tyramine oxidase, partial [Ornithinimicrobium sp.]
MASHPLDPLSEDEFRATVDILRRDQDISGSWRFASIEMQEPAKAVVKAWTEGEDIPRRALCVLWNKETNQTYEAVVDLAGDAVASWTHQPGVCPNFTVDEYHECDEAMRRHPDVVERLEGRGITDMSLVLFDVWSYGHAVMPEQHRDRRLGWCDVWLR